ncbi:uncharacterized protein LOC143916340 [Arctopsyche grandis]|uniref:uncharacterized protein LOC143916340 n=1 Tax=Arctopsyche grandis TaxID=121162 RepID=UPI00406D984F
MKIFLLFLLFGCALAAPNNVNELILRQNLERKLSDAAKEILESLRKLLLNGDQSRDIPVMDPWKVKTYSFEFSSLPLSLKISAENIVLTGLSGFNVHNIDLSESPLQLKFDFTLPAIKMDAAKYTLRGRVFDALPIYGAGAVDFEIGNFYFSGTSGVAEGPNGVYLTDLHLLLTIEAVKSDITGMLGGGDIDEVINAMLEDMAPEFFNENSEFVSELVKDPILEKVNEIFNGLSLEELKNIVN